MRFRGQSWAGVIVLVMASACGAGGDSGSIPPLLDASTTPQAAAAEAPPSTPDGVPGRDGTGPSLTEDAVISIDDSATPGEVRALVHRIDVAEPVRMPVSTSQ